MAYKYVNDERLQESLEAVRDRLVIKDKTEAQALVASASYPHCVYYTSDTHCIVVKGQIYGRGAELGSAFGFATNTSGMATWDTNKLYITPTSTSGTYQVYSYENNSWEMPGTITIDIPVSADAITYDLTDTPDLGEGDVQSAIEAVGTKIESLKAGEGITITKNGYPRIPYAYTEVEYLGGTQQSPIYTGIAGGVDTMEFECEFSYSTYVQYCAIFGNYVDENSNVVRGILGGSSGKFLVCNNTRAGSGNTTIDITANTFHTIIDNFDTVTVDGVSTNKTNKTKGTANTTNIVLFTNKEGATGTAVIGLKIKKFIIRNNNVDVLNLVPCRRNADGVLGMYDLVSKRFLTSQGTGTFTAGSDIDDNGTFISADITADIVPYDDAGTQLGVYNVQSAIETIDDKLTYRKKYINITESSYTLPAEVNVTATAAAALLWNGNTVTFPCTSGKFYGIFIRLKKLTGDTATIGTYSILTRRDKTNTALTCTDVWNSKPNINHSVGTYANPFRIFMAGETRAQASFRLVTDSGGTDSRVHHFQIENVWVMESDKTDDIIYFQKYYLTKGIQNSVTVTNDLVQMHIAMASAGGIGYDVTKFLPNDYWKNIDTDRFAYSANLYQTNSFKLTGSMYEKWANTGNIGYFPKFDMIGVTSVTRLLQNNQYLWCFPDIELNNITAGTVEMFSGCRQLRQVGNIMGITSNDPNKMFQNCHCLRRVGKLKFTNNSSGMNMFYNAFMLERIDEIDATSGFVFVQTSGYHWMRTAHPFLRYCLIKGFGTASGQTTFNASTTMAVWGVNSDEHPDARQSLVDSLLTYSFDRATAGYSNCTVTLSAATLAVLTEEEKTAITAKGYILTS